MLEHLSLRGVGPTPTCALDLASRLNLFVGDNGLGKTFLLDVAWWVLTRTWSDPSLPARPRKDAREPQISFRIRGARGPKQYVSKYDYLAQEWPGRGRGRPINPGMVIYAHSDGGFSVWDPVRNYLRSGSEGSQRPQAYIFTRKQVWDGLPGPEDRFLCNGLIRDWVSWQREGGQAFAQLRVVLDALAPSQGEPIAPGEPMRLSVDDARDHPTLRLPYDEQVLLMHASAGMRRIIALAYLLVWTWQEHVHACELMKQPVARQIVFIIDELEAHLHPRWQRTVLRSLLAVMNQLTGTNDVPVQVLAATHSPMILTSLEPLFDVEQDALWLLELSERKVTISREPWYSRGPVGHWLTSEAFGLESDRSLEAGDAIKQAKALYCEDEPVPALI
ncbi:MAG: ATP-binding protein, partial [Myxococcales bacterium]|nr:ATP-binding protein [Myxococcales bacterium]